MAHSKVLGRRCEDGKEEVEGVLAEDGEVGDR